MVFARDMILILPPNRAYPTSGSVSKNSLYIGSAIVEKANDLLVARRQKHSSMQWTRKGGDALLALKTIQINEEWDNYWLNNNAA